MITDYLVIVVSAATILAYTWSVRGHFASEGMPKGAGLIAGFVSLHAVLFCVLTLIWPQPVWAQIIGLMMQLLAAGIFVAAILASRQAQLKFVFDPINPHGLVKNGPYKFIRHPFYVSYVLFWCGWVVAVWSLWVIPSALIFVTLYVSAALQEERRFAGTPMADAYAEYSKTTGFFWPKFGRS